MFKNMLSRVWGGSEVLDNPGDSLDARVTGSNRKVLKCSKDNGNLKYSVTQYPNGTVVETKTTKRK